MGLGLKGGSCWLGIGCAGISCIGQFLQHKTPTVDQLTDGIRQTSCFYDQGILLVFAFHIFSDLYPQP